ncbi:MAG TPA: hypothetical protein VM915_08900, partial [Verrucomicrobiae bacterium]|nr:hypothetical protein [Verrucomicrobiae bacterium]
ELVRYEDATTTLGVVVLATIFLLQICGFYTLQPNEGAVEMVQHALEQLSERDIVKLDDERRATMVSNLLVVLCGDRDAQPVVNAGSLYQ